MNCHILKYIIYGFFIKSTLALIIDQILFIFASVDLLAGEYQTVEQNARNHSNASD